MKKRKDGRFLKVVTISGEKVYFYSTETTERKAERDIARQMVEYQQKQEEKENLPFNKVADEWNTAYRLTIPETTYKKGVGAQYKRILDYFQSKKLLDITPHMVDIFLRGLNYGYKTVAGHRCILNMIFVYAVLHEYTTYNPVSVVKVPKNLPRGKRELPTDTELQAVSEHFNGFELLPYLMLWTGCRKSEALALRQEDIDFGKKIIKIRNHVIHEGNRPIFEPVLKSDAARRDIILTDRLIDILPRNCEGFIFSADSQGKKPLSKGEYDHRWKKYCEQYKLDITAHQLRHGYATMLYEAGVDVKDAQALMGHSDINLTRSIYTHIREARTKETAQKINSFSF